LFEKREKKKGGSKSEGKKKKKVCFLCKSIMQTLSRTGEGEEGGKGERLRGKRGGEKNLRLQFSYFAPRSRKERGERRGLKKKGKTLRSRNLFI